MQRRAPLVAFALTALLLVTGVAFFSGLILPGRFDGAPVVPGVVQEMKPRLVIDFIAPDGQACHSTVRTGDPASPPFRGTTVVTSN